MEFPLLLSGIIIEQPPIFPAKWNEFASILSILRPLVSVLCPVILSETAAREAQAAV